MRENSYRVGFKVFLCLLLLLFFCFSSGVNAATTGKIQGTITDAQSKEGLPGVNVVLEGTTMGAATDANGFFFIINVPLGTYQLKASIVGYAVETKSDVRVYIDRTTTADFQLKTQAIAGQEVTVTASRVPVPLDVSATEAYISGEDVVESASNRFDQLMSMQAGISLSSASKEGEGFSVRGGSLYETDVRLDGMSMVNDLSRTATLAISRNLIQDVQILTGGFNAEYGNIRSGLINVITRDGSFNRYSGVLEGTYSPKGYKHFGFPFTDARARLHEGLGGAQWTDTGLNGIRAESLTGWTATRVFRFTDWLAAYETGGPSTGDSYKTSHPYAATFVGWNTLGTQNGFTATTAAELYKWTNRPIKYGQEPDLMMDIGAGGPIPFVQNTKLYVSSYWNKSFYVFPSSMPASTEYTTTAKVTKRIKANMNLVANFSYNRNTGLGNMAINDDPSFGFVTGDRSTTTSGMYMSYAESQTWPKYINNYFGSIKFTHTYSPKSYWDIEVGIQRGFVDSEHMRDRDITKIKFIDDPLLAAKGWVEKNTVTGASYGYPAGRIAIDETPRGFFLDTPHRTRVSNTLVGNNDILGRRLDGIQYLWQHDTNTTVNLRGNFVSQVNKYHQIKAGFEYADFFVNHREWRCNGPFIYGEDMETFLDEGFRIYKAAPKQLDTYIQDKFEWEGMIMNLGLRSTYWSPNTNAFNVTSENQFTPIWNLYVQWGNVKDEGNWKFRLNRTRKIETKIILQPRIGVSHPITESSKIFFNYGHFYQKPQYAYMYLVQQEQYWGSTRMPVGIPVADLPWPKTVSYEIGYSQSIYNQILLQISGYYKDVTDETQGQFVNSYYNDVRYLTYTSNHYRDIRGLEFRVERSFGRFINGWANYNYMITSEGDVGYRYLYQDIVRAEDQYFTAGQTRAETRPTFRLSFTLRTPVDFGPRILGVKPFAEWRMNWIYNWQAGGKFVYDSSLPPRDWKYVYRINYSMYDMYLTKMLVKGASFYIRVQNIFNIKILSSMGTNYRTSLRLPFTIPSGNDKYGEYDKYWINTFDSGDDYSKWVNNKRDIYFGVRYQF